METLLYLILILFIVVSIIDDSGVIDSIKRGLSKLLTKGKIVTTDFDLKPFSCSYCMNFWVGIIYLIIVGEFTIPYIAFVLLLSGMTIVTKALIDLIRDLFILSINKTYELINKLYELINKIYDMKK